MAKTAELIIDGKSYTFPVVEGSETLQLTNVFVLGLNSNLHFFRSHL